MSGSHRVLLLKVVHIHIHLSTPGSHQINRTPRTVLLGIGVREEGGIHFIFEHTHEEQNAEFTLIFKIKHRIAKKFECVCSRQSLDYTRPLVIHFHLSLGVFQEKVGEASEYRTNQQIFNIQTEPQCLQLWRFQR